MAIQVRFICLLAFLVVVMASNQHLPSLILASKPQTYHWSLGAVWDYIVESFKY